MVAIRTKTGALLAPLLFCLLLAAPVNAADVILIDDFENGLASGWEEEKFVGATSYEIVEEGRGKVLCATAEGTASGQVFEIEFDPEEHPILTWRWKIEKTIEEGDATVKSGDDYAARIYIIFPSWLPIASRSINYIWANKLPRGEHIPSTFYSKSIMVAVQSGDENAGKWVTEKRNIHEDYKKLFGKEPGAVSAIVIMTDTDQTGARAHGCYDDIRLEKARANP